MGRWPASPVTIIYSGGTVKAGMTARVVQSNRPLARVGAKTVKLKAGSTERVDLFSDATIRSRIRR